MQPDTSAGMPNDIQNWTEIGSFALWVIVILAVVFKVLPWCASRIDKFLTGIVGGVDGIKIELVRLGDKLTTEQMSRTAWQNAIGAKIDTLTEAVDRVNSR